MLAASSVLPVRCPRPFQLDSRVARSAARKFNRPQAPRALFQRLFGGATKKMPKAINVEEQKQKASICAIHSEFDHVCFVAHELGQLFTAILLP